MPGSPPVQSPQREPSEQQQQRLFWRSSDDKSHIGDLKQQLQRWADAGHSMENFSLKHAALDHINLVSQQGHNMRGADLYRADLTRAHMFAVDLSGGSLMKANLDRCNLHCANLKGCNLLGAQLNNTKLDNVIWGDKILQEQLAAQAAAAGDREQELDYLQQAEETYRNLRVELEKSGLFKQAGDFFYREMIMRRLKLPRRSATRLVSWFVDRFCGYGEKPLRVVTFSLTVITVCALVYFLSAGIQQGDDTLGYHSQLGFYGNLNNFLSCFYFSVVTFTTLGYGDLIPHGIARLMAAIEAFGGSFTMALFVVVFVKKMTR